MSDCCQLFDVSFAVHNFGTWSVFFSPFVFCICLFRVLQSIFCPVKSEMVESMFFFDAITNRDFLRVN